MKRYQAEKKTESYCRLETGCYSLIIAVNQQLNLPLKKNLKKNFNI